jgi:antitoxin component YwqK of YwqJK toxin-antitoxin module
MKIGLTIFHLTLIALGGNGQTMERIVIENIEVEIWRNYYDNGQLQKEWTQTTYDLHGYQKEFYISGKIKSHSEYRKGKKWKVDSAWYENGNLQRTIEKDPNSDLYFRIEYYEDGKIKSKSQVSEYLNNAGESRDYYPNGQLRLLMSYDETGIPNGKCISFYENGNKFTEAENRHGQYYLNNYWQADGKQIITNGNGLLSIYDKNEIIVSEEEFRDGLRNGTSKSYKNGILSYSGTYSNGKSEGKSFWYYRNGKLKEIIHMRGGIMTHAERDFPMYDNPVLTKEISIRPSDRRDADNKLIIPSVYPELINRNEVLDSIKLDQSIYDNRPQDIDVIEVYRVTLSIEGRVVDFTRSIGSGYPVTEAVENSFKYMKFDMKNQIEEGIKNQIWITFKFILSE